MRNVDYKTLVKTTVLGVFSLFNSVCNGQDNITKRTSKKMEDRNYKTVSVFAGKEDVQGWVDAQGKDAEFDVPLGLSFDKEGNLYVLDIQIPDPVIRKITPNGDVTTVETIPFAPFFNPIDTVVDSHGNVFVLDKGVSSIFKIEPNGITTVFAGSTGNHIDGYKSGFKDGLGFEAKFKSPSGLTIDSHDNIYIADTGNKAIRKITPDGLVKTIAKDSDLFDEISDLIVGIENNLYVLDRGNNSIYKISTIGEIYTFTKGFLFKEENEYKVFDDCHMLAIDISGNLFSSNIRTDDIVKINTEGIVTKLECNGIDSLKNGPLEQKQKFRNLKSIAIDKQGCIYLGNEQVSIILKIE